jgi:hypothetical protein
VIDLDMATVGNDVISTCMIATVNVLASAVRDVYRIFGDVRPSEEIIQLLEARPSFSAEDGAPHTRQDPRLHR